jgi:putative transposase
VPNTFTALYAHIVFSTLGRRRWLAGDVRQRLYPYLGGIARNIRATAIAVGGFDDHVHVLARYPARVSISEFAGKTKANSSRWIHETWPNLAEFGWQDGYSAFSVSRSRADAVARYIRGQEEHHKRISFEDELGELIRLANGSEDSGGDEPS